MNEETRRLIRQEVFKAVFLNENEIYIDLTELDPNELYPEELLRLKYGFGKGGLFTNGELIDFD